MKPFARIPAAIPRSGIREIMDLAWAVEKTGEVIHLEVGQPDFATPAPIVEATCRYIRAGHTKYVPNGGVDALRAAAARHFEHRTGVPTTSENILVTPGAVMSVATAFLSLLEPGDEVLLPDPGWPNYEMAVSIVRGRPVFYNLRAENHFLPDLDEIDRLVSPRTKLLLLCTPSNPTGQVYDEALMRELMALAQRHDLWVLSDEIYGQIVFDQPHQSALPHDADGRAIVVSGMSKSYAMTGYRVGFTRANPEYIEIATKLQEPFISCGTGFSQLASADALDGPQDDVAAMCRAYARRRDIALDVLREYDLYRYTPGGAIYLMIDISAAGMDSGEFAVRLLKEQRVAVAPGSTFGQMCRDHVRISIAASEEHIRRGVTTICEFAQQAQGAVYKPLPTHEKIRGTSALDSELLQRGFVPQPLTPAQCSALDTDGFVILEEVIAPEWLAELRRAFDSIFTREGDKAGAEVSQVEGVRRLADLVNKGKAFDAVYLQPTLLTAIFHVLQRPFKLHSLNGHDPLPGNGLQILHADWGQPTVPGGPYHVVNSMWMLDDFTAVNGATRCVPGSHHKPGRVTDYMDDRLADHPEQVHLTGRAGSVAVFNGSLWHSSYRNDSNAPRRTLHCAFIAREHPQQTNQREYLRPATAQRLSPLARYILDVE